MEPNDWLQKVLGVDSPVVGACNEVKGRRQRQAEAHCVRVVDRAGDILFAARTRRLIADEEGQAFLGYRRGGRPA